MGLVFGKGINEVHSHVIGFYDSDYASDLDRRRSLTSYIFTLGGSAINWHATLQSIIVLSTIETQYMAATKTVKKTLWLKGLIVNFGVSYQKDIIVFCDSQNTIHLTKNQMIMRGQGTQMLECILFVMW